MHKNSMFYKIWPPHNYVLLYNDTERSTRLYKLAIFTWGSSPTSQVLGNVICPSWPRQFCTLSLSMVKRTEPVENNEKKVVLKQETMSCFSTNKRTIAAIHRVSIIAAGDANIRGVTEKNALSGRVTRGGVLKKPAVHRRKVRHKNYNIEKCQKKLHHATSKWWYKRTRDGVEINTYSSTPPPRSLLRGGVAALVQCSCA